MASDVEAGKAYVTLYLRKTTFDRQVDQARQQSQDIGQNADNAGGGTTTVEEKGITIGNVGQAVAQGAAMKAGGVALSKMIPIFRETATAAAAAAPAVAGVGAAAAGTATATAAAGAAAAAATPAVAGAGTAAAGAAVATAAAGTAAAGAAPAIAATAPAAGAAATGLGAMAAAAAPLLIPLAAIAAAAVAVYVAVFKWDELPGVIKLLLVAIAPVIIVIRAMVAAFNALRAAVSVVTAPFRLVAATVIGVRDAIMGLPAACVAGAAALGRLAMRAASAAVTLAQATARGVNAAIAATGWLINATSSAMQTTGIFVAKAGGIAAALAGSIVGPLTAAAKQFAEYGEEVAKVQSEYEVSADDAAVLILASKNTGNSVKELADQMKDGTRDFTRWREEARQSGLVLGDSTGDAVGLAQAYSLLKSSIQGLWVQLGSAVAPAITETTELMTAAIRAVTAWVSENKPLIAQVFRIASGVAMAGSAIASIGGAIAGAGALLTPFTVALAGIAAGLAAIELRTGAGQGLWQTYGESVKRVYATVAQYLGQVVAFASKVFGGVTDSIKAGDISGAINIAWLGAKVAWIRGLQEIDKLTGGMMGGILKNLAAGNWSAAGEAAMVALQIAWQQGMSVLAGTWVAVVNAAERAFVSIQNALDPFWLSAEDGFLKLKSWGQGAFAELTAFAAGLGAAFADIAGKLKILLIGFAATNPAIAATVMGAVKAMGAIKGAAVDTYTTAANEARNAFAIEKGPKTRTDQERDALIAKRKRDRETESETRIGARDLAANQEQQKRDDEIERLRKRQQELAAQGADDSDARYAENEKKLNDAIKAAAAAREAADAKRAQGEDFATIEEKKATDAAKQAGIVRFSGEALAMAAGGVTRDPKKEMEALQKQTVDLIQKVVEVGKDQLAAYKEWAAKMGFK